MVATRKNPKVANMDMKRVANTAAEVPGEDEDSYTRSHKL